AEKYIIPGETAESALMFLPSEAVYAEIHANFQNVIEESQRRRVYIVSPSTMMAMLNTVRAVLKDVSMREQAGVIQTEVMKLLNDVRLLDERAEKLERNFGTISKTVGEVRTSAKNIFGHGKKIETIELGDETPADDLAPTGAPAGKPHGISTNKP
ncbi:MAG: DNA recombination protein RmuC, partial [Rhodospirillaceae bacterium]|nr:DNA recombination protein RmuC [Rhodospirillaceae bacterium]